METSTTLQSSTHLSNETIASQGICDQLSEETASIPKLGDDFLETYSFGGKLAQTIGADLSDERANEKKSQDEIDEEARMAEAARPQNWKAKLATMTFDEQVDATLECLGRKNNQKEILYDLLVFCQTERTEQEAEAFLEQHKQFADGYHTANKYLLFMERTGALEELQYDAEGVLITDEMRNELRDLDVPEDEIDELAQSWHVRTSAVGEEAIARFDPVVRTKEMLSTQKASRLASFQRLLGFCETPRSLAEIVAFMDGDPGLEIDPKTGVMAMQPSAYIGKLDQSGALTWENGWKTTKGGMEVLTTINFD